MKPALLDYLGFIENDETPGLARRRAGLSLLDVWRARHRSVRFEWLEMRALVPAERQTTFFDEEVGKQYKCWGVDWAVDAWK